MENTLYKRQRKRGEVMKNLKKLTAVVCTSAMIVSLTACGSPNEKAGTKENVTIQFMHGMVEEERQQTIQGLIDKFEESNPGITVEQVPTDDDSAYVGQMEASTGAIVETNAYFTKNSVRPIFSGRLPDGVKIMMDRHLETQQMILKAAFDRNLNLAFEAFYNDPMLGRLDRKQAKELFNIMVTNTKEYLPGYEIS